MASVRVESQNVKYTQSHIEATYEYATSTVELKNNQYVVKPSSVGITICTERKVPQLGVMLVGWGGNNGTTVTAAVLANRYGLSWTTKDGINHANYYGSVTQASTLSLGNGTDNQEVFVPFNNILPLVQPNNIIFDGWDISSLNLADAMERSKVLDYGLQTQLRPYMKNFKPRASIYFPDFIAANQADRADHVLSGSKWEQLEKIREDIRDFKKKENLDKVIVLWTANTERFSNVLKGLNDNSENLIKSIHANAAEVSPSTIFSVASILEGCAYINGSPQNTFVPGVIELAAKCNVFIGGDDFKSGQTKMKSVLVDFLVGAGIKPVSIVSYNHLGNNDGKNLSAPQQFRSKEISKSNVVDDMVSSNAILYNKDEKPDHCVVIKYVPYVGDSKRAMDEYTSEIMLGGHNTIVMHNTCEDSLLASPLIIDLVILTEICQRISFRVGNEKSFQPFNCVLSILSYLCKAPLVPKGTPIVNALFKQRTCIENIFRACLGLKPQHHMALEHKLNNLNSIANQIKQKEEPINNTKQANGSYTKHIRGHEEKISNAVGHLMM